MIVTGGSETGEVSKNEAGELSKILEVENNREEHQLSSGADDARERCNSHLPFLFHNEIPDSRLGSRARQIRAIGCGLIFHEGRQPQRSSAPRALSPAQCARRVPGPPKSPAEHHVRHLRHLQLHAER
eukprot:scaffold434_cov186-Pinguiococcus_pyrenoidosus.AAC.142